mgnify:CR=1 FL=1
MAALLSGVLLALSFPKYGHPAVAFIALVPWLIALSGWSGRGVAIPGVSTRRGFRLGLIAGFIHFAGTVYWTGATVSTFGGLPAIVAVMVAALLALYMATYIAVAGAIIAILTRRFGLGGLCLAPAAWVAMEYLRGIIFGGFPWIPLGNTMVTLLPIAQLASVAGVYGLSWFVALVNVGFAVAALGPPSLSASTFAEAPADRSADRARLIAAGGSNLTYRVTDPAGHVWALRRPPVAVRIGPAALRGVHALRGGDDARGVSAREDVGARFDGFRSLGVVPKRHAGNAERTGLLLESA